MDKKITYRKPILKRTAITWMFFLVSMALNAQITIIVNPANPLDELSQDELKSIFLGKTEFFENNELIRLCDFVPDKEDFCQKTYGFSEKRMSQYWFQRIFSGAATKSPKAFKSAEDLIEYVSQNEGAIGFIEFGKIKGNNGIKILKIEGLSPKDSGYPLSWMPSKSSFAGSAFLVLNSI